MISGRVENRQALVSVPFRLAGRPDLNIEFVVDTGFTDFLCLPPQAVTALGLPYEFDMPANLANDSEVALAVHSAIIVWDDIEREVRVLATGRRPLLGTALLDGCEFVAQFAEGGMVTIDTL